MAAERPDGSDQALGKAFTSRIDAVVGQWRARLRQQLRGGGPGTHETIGDAETDLREQVTALERDAVGLKETLSRELLARAEAEQSAMASISANDDDGARAALRAHERHADVASRIQAELTVLEAMVETCRESLSTIAAMKDAELRSDAPPSDEKL